MMLLIGRIKQTLAVVLAQALVFTSLALPQTAQASAQPAILQSLRLSSNLGSITDSYAGSTGKQVILIQDLHLHYPTQKRILKILNRLFSKGLITGPIAIEGLQGDYDTTPLANFSADGRKTKEKLVDYLMRKGELSGDEAFAVLRGEGHRLFGVDHSKYYQLNRELYNGTRKERKALEARLAMIQRKLDFLKKENGGSEANATLAKNFAEIEESLFYLQLLLRQETTLEDVRHIAQRLPQFVDLTRKLLEMDTHGGPFSGDLEEILKASVDFYAVALMRDEPLAKNTLALLDQTNTVVLVGGGFHTAGLVKKFKKVGVSYAVITPHVNEVREDYHALYESRVAGEHVSLQEIANDFRLNPDVVAHYQTTVPAGGRALRTLGTHYTQLKEGAWQKLQAIIAGIGGDSRVRTMGGVYTPAADTGLRIRAGRLVERSIDEGNEALAALFRPVLAGYRENKSDTWRMRNFFLRDLAVGIFPGPGIAWLHPGGWFRRPMLGIAEDVVQWWTYALAPMGGVSPAVIQEVVRQVLGHELDHSRKRRTYATGDFDLEDEKAAIRRDLEVLFGRHGRGILSRDPKGQLRPEVVIALGEGHHFHSQAANRGRDEYIAYVMLLDEIWEQSTPELRDKAITDLALQQLENEEVRTIGGGFHFNKPPIFKVLKPYGLWVRRTSVYQLKGNRTHEEIREILSDPQAAGVLEISVAQGLGSIGHAGRGKINEFKLAADKEAVFLADQSLIEYVNENTDEARVIEGDEGIKDKSYCLKLGRIYYHKYIGSKKDFDGPDGQLDRAALQIEIRRLEERGVKVRGVVGDSLEGTEGLVDPLASEATMIPTNSWGLIVLTDERNEMVDDNIRLGGISYAAASDAGVGPFDLPSVAFPKIAAADGIEFDTPEYTDWMNHNRIILLGKARHEAIIADGRTLGITYPGFRIKPVNYGDAMPRVIAGSGLILDGYRTYGFGRSGGPEAEASLVPAVNNPQGRFTHTYVSTRATDKDYSQVEAYRYTEEELALFARLGIDPKIQSQTRGKERFRGKGLLAMTAVTGASPEVFGNTFAQLLPRIQFIRDYSGKGGEVVVHTLLVTRDGGVYVVRTSLFSHNLAQSRNLLYAASSAIDSEMNISERIKDFFLDTLGEIKSAPEMAIVLFGQEGWEPKVAEVRSALEQLEREGFLQTSGPNYMYSGVIVPTEIKPIKSQKRSFLRGSTAQLMGYVTVGLTGATWAALQASAQTPVRESVESTANIVASSGNGTMAIVGAVIALAGLLGLAVQSFLRGFKEFRDQRLESQRVEREAHDDFEGPLEETRVMTDQPVETVPTLPSNHWFTLLSGIFTNPKERRLAMQFMNEKQRQVISAA